MKTVNGKTIPNRVLGDYFTSLIGGFFKILPLWEEKEQTLGVYLESLQVELLGSKSLICALQDDSATMTLISILQYMMDNPDLPVHIVKREVFKAINICQKIAARYKEEDTG